MTVNETLPPSTSIHRYLVRLLDFVDRPFGAYAHFFSSQRRVCDVAMYESHRPTRYCTTTLRKTLILQRFNLNAW